METKAKTNTNYVCCLIFMFGYIQCISVIAGLNTTDILRYHSTCRRFMP